MPGEPEKRLEGRMPVLRSGCYEAIGTRLSMEDAHIMVDDMSGYQFDSEFRKGFYGVFDGHGGKSAALYTRNSLLLNFLENESFPTNISSAFINAFDKTDSQLEGIFKGTSDTSGTTAIVLFVHGKSLVVANVGDSRAVLSRAGKALDLSWDQKPSVPIEKDRILAAGGILDMDNYVNGELAVARALGNWHLSELKIRDSNNKISGPLISKPELHFETITEEDEFIIMACDGLWDTMTSSEAVKYARERLQEHNDPKKCSEDLVKMALTTSCDNVTALVVSLSDNPPPKLKPKKPWRRRAKSTNCSSVDTVNDVLPLSVCETLASPHPVQPLGRGHSTPQ